MPTFYELYDRIVKEELSDEGGKTNSLGKKFELDAFQLDCLLHPEKHPAVWRMGDCGCKGKSDCEDACAFDAITKSEGEVHIDPELCAGCGDCIDACKAKNLVESKETVAMLRALRKEKRPVYAMIAPAFIGQFSREVTPGKLRTAFKRLNFTGMVEVALFADILTLKEALEFDKKIKTDQDFMLTSCCCPMWIAMIRKIYSQLVPHVPPSVSPMVACGRAIKKLHPDAITVFIGPCLAKKAEAKERDIADAVDYVLTFKEIADVFEFAGIRPAELPDDPRDHSSTAGRIYAHTGGVSEAVKATVERLRPGRKITLHAEQANGVPQCKKMLDAIRKGEVTANFLEGMGCVGGCVGGPRVLIDRREGRENVSYYGEEAQYKTPLDNPYVIELLHRLEIPTVNALLKEADLFTRNLDKKEKEVAKA